ncbi:MAG TPA: PAS domain S-box protein [Candidatus Hydrogenedentes bacterium]|nr:PAS domain S-box protein [Candidatus Hydrogenedentota bacterium]
MESDPAKHLYRQYNRIIAGTAILFVIVIIALSGLQYWHFRRIALQVAAGKLSERATHFDGVLSSTTAHVQMMQRWGEDFFAEASGNTPLASRCATLPFAKAGGGFVLDRGALEESEKYGSIVGLDTSGAFDEDFQRELDMALAMFRIQRNAHQLNADLAWSYYQSARHFVAIFPPFADNDVPHLDDVQGFRTRHLAQYKKERWTQGIPENNPERRSYWTHVYADALGKGLMVTCCEPLYHGERFLGIVAADITLDRFRKHAIPFTYPNSSLIVGNDLDQVLTHSHYLARSASAPTLLPDVLPGRLGGIAATMAHHGKPERRRVGAYNIFSAPLRAAPWTFFYVMPEKGLAALFLPSFTAYLGLILALTVALFTARVLIMRRFLSPSLALVKHIHAEAQQGPTPPPKVPKLWLPWFRRVSNILALKSVTANLPGAVYQFVLRKDGTMELPFVSVGVLPLLGISPQQAEALDMNRLDFVSPEDRDKLRQAILDSARDMTPFEYETLISLKPGRSRWVRLLTRPRRNEVGDTIWEGVMLDVTDRRKVEQEREKLIQELRNALAQIKTLRGLLPICACCKKVRDDNGYWNQIEHYLSQHSDVYFTHGFCPDCLKELYKEFYGDDEIDTGERNVE